MSDFDLGKFGVASRRSGDDAVPKRSDRTSWSYKWAGMHVGSWLRNLHLERYESTFIKNAVDIDVLRQLTEQDLEWLGIPLGDRKRLIEAISKMRPAASGRAASNLTEAFRPGGAPAAAERRHLTVLICDLVASTALSARLDPEDMSLVLDSFHSACADITKHFDGFVADFRGDGILAYFGYPHAHEDDAERTVRAALDMIRAVAQLETPAGEPLSVRIGIASGVVLITNSDRDGVLRHTPVGDTPNLAARVQELAEPGSIAVADSTRRLLGGRFRLRSLGKHTLKGIAGAVETWAVDGLSSFDRLHALNGPTDFVGRQRELDVLLDCQRVAWNGEGRVVLVAGEPGIGKSRLVAALQKRIVTPHTRLHYQCSPYYTGSALYPFIMQLERAAGFVAEDTPNQRLDKLEVLLAKTKDAIEDVVPVFAGLLSIPTDDRYARLAGSADQQRHRTLTALLQQFEALASSKPVLLVFDDAQWADAASFDLLALATERLKSLPVLAIILHRLHFEVPFARLPDVVTLELGPLDRHNVESIVANLRGERSLPADMIGHIVGRTDGNPLFVEELTKTLLEAETLATSARDAASRQAGLEAVIPSTLHDSLMARLDRLGRAKEIAQISATIGREFSYSLLGELTAGDAASLADSLAALEQAELVFRNDQETETSYTFKHALVRDAAYESLTKTRRKQLHARIARVLEAKFSDIVERHPEILAHHFAEAQLAEPAVDYWLRAGQLALARSAKTAVEHLRQGLRQVAKVSDPARRMKDEILLQISLGNSLRASEGWCADAVKEAYIRAVRLSRESGLEQLALPAIFGLWSWHFVRPSLRKARDLADDLSKAAEIADDSIYGALASEASGLTMFAQGRFSAAHDELRRSIAMCAGTKATRSVELSAQDLRVHARVYDGMASWFLGYPDQALIICAEANQYADATEDAFSRAIARAITLRVHQFREEPTVVAFQAPAAISLCEEYGFRYYSAVATILYGWAIACEGDLEEGVAKIQAGRTNVRATGALLYDSYALGLIADAYLRSERHAQALEVLREARSTLDDHDYDHFYAAEIYRLTGEAHLRTGGQLDAAEHYFLKGLALAREQNSRALELRICIRMHDLCEFDRRKGDFDSQLAAAYRFFTEGFDTPDLLAARARLQA